MKIHEGKIWPGKVTENRKRKRESSEK